MIPAATIVKIGSTVLTSAARAAPRHDASDGGYADDWEERIAWDRHRKQVASGDEPQRKDAECGPGQAEWNGSERRNSATAARPGAAL
jgi:hypothetical protein